MQYILFKCIFIHKTSKFISIILKLWFLILPSFFSVMCANMNTYIHAYVCVSCAHVSLYVYAMCVIVNVYECVSASASLWICAHERKKQSLFSSISLCFECVFQWSWSSEIQLDYRVNELQGSDCLFFPLLWKESAITAPGFDVHSRNYNLALYGWTIKLY